MEKLRLRTTGPAESMVNDTLSLLWWRPELHTASSIEALTLGTRETIGWPAKGMPIRPQDGILLFHAKPRVLVVHHFHDFVTSLAQVGFC